MKKSTFQKSRILSSAGFSLIELAIGMAIVGIILGGALLIGGKLWEAERREVDVDHLNETKAALLDFARKNGRFPMMDTSLNSSVYGDGLENSTDFYMIPTYFGWVPYKNIDTKGTDALGRPIQYFVNWQLAREGGVKPCQALNNFFKGKITAGANIFGYIYQYKWSETPPEPGVTPQGTAWCWFPLLKFNNNAAYQIPVAAVIIGLGQNNTFDLTNNTANTVTGKNFDKSVTIDDVVVYVTLAEAYAALNCQ